MLYNLIFLWLAALVAADFSITAPKLGQSVQGGDTVKVTWEDDGNKPALDDIKSITVTLVTGTSNTELSPQGVKLKEGVEPDAGSVTVTIPKTAGKDGYYTIQLYGLLANGGYTIHYTNWFDVSGLTGTLPALQVNPGQPPAKQMSDLSEKAQGDLLASHTVPYGMQSGTIKYAPMQMQPGSTITAKTMSRRFPTSAYTPFVSFYGPPKCTSTDTPGWSYSRMSATNMAPPAAYPSAAGWYPASAKTRATPSLMKTAAPPSSTQANTVHKKRWFDVDEWIAPKTRTN